MIPPPGYLKSSVDVADAITRLSGYINDIPIQYKAFTPEELLHKAAQNKWSRQEILGHLIDSAINNLKCFTEIQFLPQPYMVQSYKQEELVIANNYQHLPIEHLLILWQALNQQIIYVAQNIPPDKLDVPVNPQYENNEMRTLGWIICDYVAHLEHHLKQL